MIGIEAAESVRPGRFRVRARPASTPVRRAPLPLLLAGLGIAGLALLPIAYLVIRALGADPDSLDLVLRARTLTVAASTVGLALFVGAGTIALGVPLAWLTTRTDLPGRRAWAVLTVVPLAIPSYVTGFAFLAAFGPRGSLQSLLAPLGVERLPSIGGLFGATLVLVLVTYPYVVLATRAAILRTDPAVEDAARLLGDRRATVFRRVTLPVLAPAIAAGALLAILYALSDFGAVSLLQFDSFSRAIYVQYRASFDRSLAAILALMLVAMTLAVAWGETRVRRRAGAYATVGRTARRPVTVLPLGRWRWPAAVFCAAVVGIALVVPAGTIGWWLVRGLAQGEPVRFVADAALNSFLAGGGAALMAVLLALPIGLLVARFPSRSSGLIEGATYTGYALPGIVIALSVVFLATNALPVLYQTLVLLVLAYAVRFLPQAVGTIRAALVTVGPRVEEAGRTLGDGPARAFLRLTVPLLRPSLVAGGALVFLTVVKELPMALLLGPIGFETLATRIWDAASEGFYARAAAPAALLLVLSTATVALLLRSEDRVR
ncbi:MAG TPA: iron ABC transporter permease [Clostridia bacterium]|nr:iron ABC transporter permease [Clostridia bacterium]